MSRPKRGRDGHQHERYAGRLVFKSVAVELLPGQLGSAHPRVLLGIGEYGEKPHAYLDCCLACMLEHLIDEQEKIESAES